jgi:hypothetical protein
MEVPPRLGPHRVLADLEDDEAGVSVVDRMELALEVADLGGGGGLRRGK